MATARIAPSSCRPNPRSRFRRSAPLSGVSIRGCHPGGIRRLNPARNRTGGAEPALPAIYRKMTRYSPARKRKQPCHSPCIGSTSPAVEVPNRSIASSIRKALGRSVRFPFTRDRIWEASPSRSIEHVHPQNPAPGGPWQGALGRGRGQKEAHINRLGNLVLLPPGMNSTVGNREKTLLGFAAKAWADL